MLTPRLLNPDDADAYLAFRRAALIESPWAFMSSPDDDHARSLEALRANLRESENIIVAMMRDDDADDAVEAVGAGRILAAAGVLRERKIKARHRAFIWGVYCVPAARGNGYGRAVVHRAIEVAKSWPGVERITLSVSVHHPAAIGLYRSLGFEEWGREPDALRVDGRSYDEIHMFLRV